MKLPAFATSEQLKKLAPKYCKGRLVDVGAGRAKYKEILMPYITEYVAVDNASSDYQYKNHSADKYLNVIAEADAMPFKNNEFDTAVCVKVIEHVKDPLAVVKEINRVLKPGGYLLLSSDWFTPSHKEPHDYWRFTEEGYHYLGETAGFKWVECFQQGGVLVSYNYIFWRTLELHGGKLGKKLYRFFAQFRTFLDHILWFFDKKFKTPDGIGHMVVLQK